MRHFADRLLDAVDSTRSYLTVGLDPDLAAMPPELLVGSPADLAEAADAAERFCRVIVDGVAGSAAAVKPQSAFFEQFGAAGLAALERTIARARDAGLLTIEDAKRGDIGTTMAAYATAALGRQPLAGAEVPVHDSDAVTLSPYLGVDSLAPMAEAARLHSKGLFVLVRTSNPGSADLQLLETAGGRLVFEHVAAIVDALGATDLGERGYSSVGAVCGLTHPEDARRLRELMPRSLLLVPGLGAQGGAAGDFPLFLDAEGQGATVAASRSIASGWRSQPADLAPEERVRRGARDAAEAVNEEIDRALAEAGRSRW